MKDFRKNAFGEAIAQPDADRQGIDSEMCNKGVLMAEIWSADLYTERDEQYGYGGTLHLSGEDDEGDPVDADVEFDGFESLDAAKAWLQSIELNDSQITEIS